MTVRRPVAEKVMAVAGVFNALATELEGRIELSDPRVQSALLNTSTWLVVSSDTRDMGIMAPLPKRAPARIAIDTTPLHLVCAICGRTRDFSDHDHPSMGHGFTPAVPHPDTCDDCGMPGGAHDYEVEH